MSAPDLVDVETVAVLRKRWVAGSISVRRFSTAIADLETIAMDRYPTLPFMLRIPANPYTQSGVFVHGGVGGRVAADAELRVQPLGVTSFEP